MGCGERRAWASHSWMVETPQLMIIIIIPALASSFHAAGPCLAGWASPTNKSSWGGAGQGRAGGSWLQGNTTPLWVSSPVRPGNFLTLEAGADFLKGETEAQSQGMM